MVFLEYSIKALAKFLSICAIFSCKKDLSFSKSFLKWTLEQFLEILFTLKVVSNEIDLAESGMNR